MGFFGKKYSREKYDAAVEKVHDSVKQIHNYSNGSRNTVEGNAERQETLHDAANKRDKLFDVARKEAGDLEKKHDELLRKVAEAKANLVEFEIKELEMHEGTVISPERLEEL